MIKTRKHRYSIIGIVLSTICVMLLAAATMAGDLQPTDPPAPTMHTLGEIYDQVQALSASPDPVTSDSIFGVSTGINMTVESNTQGVIEGSCTIEERQDTINVVAFEHRVSVPLLEGLPSGTRNHSPITVLKYIDKATPRLFMALVRGETLNPVEVKFYRKNSTGAEILYYTIELEDAMIVEIESSSPNFEKVSFLYRTITWTIEDGGITGQDDWREPQA
ncbi:type VI secretion system tube protein TssD [Thermodesulfobacteriota bacterium]